METNQVCDETQRIAGVCFPRDELPLTGQFTRMWTKRQNPEWQPRRASVATCQQQQQNHLLAQHYGYKTTYQFNLTRANIEEIISQRGIQHNKQEEHQAHQRNQKISNQSESAYGSRPTREPGDQDIKSEIQREKVPGEAAILLTTSEGDEEQRGVPTIGSANRSLRYETTENGSANVVQSRSSLTSSASIQATSTSAITDQPEPSNDSKPEFSTKEFDLAQELRCRCANPSETEQLLRAVSKLDAKSCVNQSGNLVDTSYTTCCSDPAADTRAISPPECELNCPVPYNLTSENMSEKLEMQDRQRKHVILSMALKQMMTEPSNSELNENKSASIDQDCCHCCCRSRSCSIGSVRDSVEAYASLTSSSRSGEAKLVGSKSVCAEAVRAYDANESSDVGDQLPAKEEGSFVDIIPMSKRPYGGASENDKLAAYQQEEHNIFRPKVLAKQKYQHRNSHGEDLVSKANPMRQLVEGKNPLECGDSAHDMKQWRNHSLQVDEREYEADEFDIESRPGSTSDQWHKASRSRNETARSNSALEKSNIGCMHSPGHNPNNHDDVNLEALIVESWLDDHPNFTRDYIMRKATRQVVDDWLVANAKVSNTNLSSQVDLRSSISSISRPVSQISHGVNIREASWKGSQMIGSGPDLGKHESQCPDLEGSLRANRSNSQSVSATNRAHGFVAPIRKISATDFETRTGTGYLRPMLSKTPDGRLTFLPQTAGVVAREQADLLRGTVMSKKHDSHRSNTENLRASDASRVNSIENGARAIEPLIGEIGSTLQENNDPEVDNSERTNQVDGLAEDDSEVKLIFELVKNIYDDLDIRTLLHKILKNIAVLINADRSSLFLVCGGPNDPNRRLVSQLFNVDQDSIDVGEPDESITIPWGTGLVGYVAESGEAVNIINCYEDPRFTDAVDQRTGYLTKDMLCAPIFDKHNEIVGVAQVINRRDGKPFSESDELKFIRYLQFCGIGLRNAQSYEHCQLENRRNQVLLDLARMVFEEQSTIEQVVYRIMLHTQSLLDCERCQVLLIDDGNDELENLHKISSYRNSAFLNNEISALRRTEKCSLYGGHIKSDNGKEYNSIDGAESESCQQPSPKLFSLVFDLECDGNNPVIHKIKDEPDPKSGTPNTSRAFPVNIGITGYVAMTGETLNIENAHQHERFDVSVDEASDFKHKSILCMPIRNGQRQIIGVIQLVNKKNGQPFNKNDEDLFEAFAIFCGLGIHNTLMYERVLKVMAKQRVTFEVLSYHATAPLEEAKKLAQEQTPSCYALNLASLKFNDFSLDDQYMLKSCLRFFLDLDLIRRFQIDQLVFCNWILSVQKNYRKLTYHPIVGGNGLKASPVRYHNWRHAFNVSQMMFAILVNTQVCQALGELETLALLIACLCHDLDHRGTNNSFQIKSASPLAELYSTSTMEHHHFDQCVMILNSQGNQILSNLSPEEYSKVIILLEEAILATDLANYFRNRDRFFQLINSNKFDWHNDRSHRSLLRCMLMTACDVAAITKPWPVQKVVADLVMSEFYQQGDIEKTELKIEPIDMMNRDKMSQLPKMQISFIDNICAPIYTAFAKLFPVELTTLLDGCLSNRNLWQEMGESQFFSDTPLISYLGCDSDEPDEKHSSLPDSNGSKSETNLLILGTRRADIIALSRKDLCERGSMHDKGLLTTIIKDTCDECARRNTKPISHRKSI